MAVVGLERTFYNVSEEDKHVELCADVLLPNTECPIEFPFDIYLVLSNESAGVLINSQSLKVTNPFVLQGVPLILWRLLPAFHSELVKRGNV